MNIKITTSYKPIRDAIVTGSSDDEATPAVKGIHVHALWSGSRSGVGAYEYFITDILVYIADALPDFEAIEDAIADWDWETRGFEFDFNSDTIEIERFVDPDRGRSKSTVQWENT